MRRRAKDSLWIAVHHARVVAASTYDVALVTHPTVASQQKR
jgi:hypothetical protein